MRRWLEAAVAVMALVGVAAAVAACYYAFWYLAVVSAVRTVAEGQP